MLYTIQSFKLVLKIANSTCKIAQIQSQEVTIFLSQFSFKAYGDISNLILVYALHHNDIRSSILQQL